LSINGSIVTNGRGNLFGPGYAEFGPVVASDSRRLSLNASFGASYGGSGGRMANCSDINFVNTYEQVSVFIHSNMFLILWFSACMLAKIGSVAVVDDLFLPAEENPSFGSGGGVNGGRGGGRILLTSNSSILLYSGARLSARGSSSVTLDAGSGSGGSIVLNSQRLTHMAGGILDVRGGDGSEFSGAGGGGRISVMVCVNIFC
jgi:hypothetical protein